MSIRRGGSLRVLLLVLGAALLLLIGVQTALAITPNDVQYGGTTTTATTGTTTAAPTGTTTAPTGTTTAPTGGTKGEQLRPPKTTSKPLNTAKASGTLPFTGLDLGIVSLGGALVLAGGVGLRRLGRKSSRQSK